MAENIINFVYDWRNKKSLTQEALAEQVGVTRQTIIAIERGNYTPSVALALKLAKTFNITVQELFHLTYDK